MAAAESGLDAFDSLDLLAFKNALTDLRSAQEMMDDVFSRPGAQLSDKQLFTNKKGDSVNASPVLVDLRRLVQLSPNNAPSALTGDSGIVPGISNRDLLHAVVGLYDVNLSDMTTDILYSTVCEKWARTIVLIRDINETKKSLEENKHKATKTKNDGDVQKTETDNHTKEKTSFEEKEENTEDKFIEEESQPSLFADVYSDTESEEGEEEEEADDEDEDFSKGIKTFINNVKERRKKRKTEPVSSMSEEDVGIENRLIGCITFEKKYVDQKDRVIHLTLLTVRKRFRKYGIGKYLLQQVIDPAVVGHYDAVVVHADNSAVDFFKKFGFSDDIVLNSRWSDLAEQFTNCTLMCYLPGFSGHMLLSTVKIPGFEVFEIEQEFNKWKKKSTEMYQTQVSLVMRMKHEILQLKNLSQKQNHLIESLMKENDILRKERQSLEKEYLDYRFSSSKTTSLLREAKLSESEMQSLMKENDDDISTDDLISDLQKQVNLMDIAIKKKRLRSLSEEKRKSCDRYMTIDDSKYVAFSPTSVRNQSEPYDHVKDAAFFYDVTEQFKKSMKFDLGIKSNYEVTTIAKATLPNRVTEAYKNRISSLQDSSMVIDLYFCGTLEHPEKIPEILKNGFSEADFSSGEYGRGLYFSRFPSKAAHFSSLEKILLVEVALGKVETVMLADKTRKAPSTGFDSIIIPGRLFSKSATYTAEEKSMMQEYVVFDVKQVLPLCLISYAGT